MGPFESMIVESERAKMPAGFRDDLFVHDRKRLFSSDPPERFGWVLREFGTLLLDASMSNLDRLAYFDHLTESDSRESDRFYFWDGSQLASVTARIMCERMTPHATHEANRSRY